jgi:polysaccharide export outer membrane protein
MLFSSCASFCPKGMGFAPKAQQPASTSQTEGVYGYILGPDDVVRLMVQQHPEWSGEFAVRPDGKIFITGVGEIKLEGLLKEGAEVAIATQIEKLINNPKVTVDIVRYASQSIYILGEVGRPGRYSTEGKNVTLRDAVIIAGFPGRFAADKRVYVITPAKSKPTQQVVNLYRILYRGELARNIQLKPGDIVYVPKNIWGEISELFSVILSPLTTTVPAARAVITPIP